MLKKTGYIFLILILGVLIYIYFFSPTKINNKGEIEVGYSILINDSVSNVFKYMGNSNYAKDWSSYVDHISLLSGEDGEVNCKRRCFKEANESGIRWDEEILVLENNKKRVLSIFNGKNFPIYSNNLITEQIYEDKGGKCKLSLILRLKGKQKLWENFKFKFASFIVVKVFKSNLINIKNEIE